ncbi:MAG: hypothetical protein ACK5N8_03930 [Alphaproteobacteria bacterium]
MVFKYYLYRKLKTFLVLLVSVLWGIPKAHSDVIKDYTSLLNKIESYEIESAYSISFEKVDEKSAKFFTYEQDENDVWQKVYYSYDLMSSSGKELYPTYNRLSTGNFGEEIFEHFISNTVSPLNVNGAANCSGKIACGGAIYNESGTISKIIATFRSNL